MAKDKGLIRSLSRKGSRSVKGPRVAAKMPPLPEPAACERCGAIFARRTWRRNHPVTPALMLRVTWTVCPACRQTGRGEGFGRVRIRGTYALAREDPIRRRIRNVAERAEFTHPERRIVSVERDGDAIEVLTTSQKLAHRVVQELKKAFRGRASYSWSDRDGSLFAVWERE